MAIRLWQMMQIESKLFMQIFPRLKGEQITTGECLYVSITLHIHRYRHVNILKIFDTASEAHFLNRILYYVQSGSIRLQSVYFLLLSVDLLLYITCIGNDV